MKATILHYMKLQSFLQLQYNESNVIKVGYYFQPAELSVPIQIQCNDLYMSLYRNPLRFWYVYLPKYLDHYG